MKNLARVFAAVLIGIAVWTCTLSEPDKPDTLTLTLHDSLKTASLKYDSIKIDLYTVKGADTVYAKNLFHGAYVNATQLSNLDLGMLANGNFTLKLIGFRDGEKVLELRLGFSGGDPGAVSVDSIKPPDTPKVIITWPRNGHVTNQGSIDIQWGVDSANTGVVMQPPKTFYLDEGEMPLTLLDTNGRGIVGQATIHVTRVSGTLFVYAAALDSGDGNSWATAYRNLQTALARVTTGWDVWVAKGTYRPFKGTGLDSTTGDTSFVMKAGVDWFGGFAGNEKALGLRNWVLNETILSGERGDTVITDNSGRIVIGANNAALDGFVVERAFTRAVGGGSAMENVMVSPGILNCVFRSNVNRTPDQGATIWDFSSSAQFQNCLFFRNESWHVAGIYNGGAGTSQILNTNFIENQSGNPGSTIENSGSLSITLSNCAFLRNSGSNGAAIVFNSTPLILSNCIFADNHATGLGGAIFSSQGGSLTNCVFARNTAANGGAIYVFNPLNVLNSTFFENTSTNRGAAIFISSGDSSEHSRIRNSIFWNNSSTRGVEPISIANGTLDLLYSGGNTLYQDTVGFATLNIGPGNISSFPSFLNTLNLAGGDGMFFTRDDGLSLYLGPFINAGDPDITGLPNTDISGSPRIVGGSVDFGAYEQ